MKFLLSLFLYLTLFCGVSIAQSNNVIEYTSSDGNVVTPYKSNVFGATIVSNKYENGKGSITFDGAVTSIGREAFSSCRNLTNITIPENVTSIGMGAFYGCSGLTSITIPENVTSIGSFAFYYCSGLTTITIPESVTSIGDYAFSYCSGLTSITIPESVTSIGDHAFSYCSGLTSITIPESVTSIGSSAFSHCSRLTSITIPENVTSIGSSAFSHCSRLTSITIPENVISIGSSAFSYCFDLASISIPESVASIGEQVFYRSYGLTSIIVESGNPNYDSRNGCNAIIETSTNTLLWGCQNTFIPESVTSIGDYAFSYCSGLTSITIPESVTSIGSSAFHYCSSLTSITIPESVTNIGSSAFEGCFGLTSIIVESGNANYDSRNNCDAIIETSTNTLLWGCQKTFIPESVTSIGEGVFYCCERLKSITIPESVTSIGMDAFFGCHGLKSITIPESVAKIENRAFGSCYGLTDVYVEWESPLSISNSVFSSVDLSNVTLHIPYGTKELYETADIWKEFGTIVEDTDVIEIVDGTSYTRDKYCIADIIYSRTFSSADKWQALYVPFSIPVETLEENGLKVAELNNIHMYDTDGDKQFDKTTLEFLYLTDGETEANYPYLIKADKAGEVRLTLKNTELKAAEETQIECASTRTTFKIKGTYSGVSGADMFNNNYYAVGGGSLVRAASADNALKPQRWYMSIENKNGSPVEYYAPKVRIMINGVEIDEEETGIQNISTMSGSKDVIYTLDGRKVNASSLPSGIYVKNHKKMIVR